VHRVDEAEGHPHVLVVTPVGHYARHKVVAGVAHLVRVRGRVGVRFGVS
jgi:hypothetical protein